MHLALREFVCSLSEGSHPEERAQYVIGSGGSNLRVNTNIPKEPGDAQRFQAEDSHADKTSSPEKKAIPLSSYTRPVFAARGLVVKDGDPYTATTRSWLVI